MRLSYSGVQGKKTNTSYPFVAEISSAADLKKVVAIDHVCAIYRDGYNQRKRFIKGYRSNKTFQEADCLPFDCDNTPTDPLSKDLDASSWKTPKDVADTYPDVCFYVVYSKNHMNDKDGRSARPRFHVYFPLASTVRSTKAYNSLKKQVRALFPAFDDKALDAARFFFGVPNPQVEYFDGHLCIDEWLSQSSREIVQSARNSTMSHFAGIVLKKYGSDDTKAFDVFMQRAQNCQPPLDPDELDSIWTSALGFYENTIKADKNYISPSEYNSMEFEEALIPADFTDVGQAKAFHAYMGDKILYVKGLGLHYYTGKYWKCEELLVQKALQHFTYKQLCLAWKLKNDADSDEELEKAEAFYKFVLCRRKSSNIKATLTELKPMVQQDLKVLNANGFLLNTPAGTVDLATGTLRAHDPKDYCTKITKTAPDNTGMDEWLAFLERFTCGDKELEAYLQLESGMESIGEVFNENLVVQYGSGGNGKSTYNNAKFIVLGDYAGTISAELLTVRSGKNKGAELAETHGKRLIIAAELPEGKRLDTAALKNLASTDQIRAEKKFEAPYEFLPTHTTVLYTNHLPKVGTIDKGTWDRILVIPLRANFRGMKGEVKNYAKSLAERCGGAILQWMIDGAAKYIQSGYALTPPGCVKQAIEEYREENDWIGNFLAERCELNPTSTEQAGALYEHYRAYCDEFGEYKRSNTDFKRALISRGIAWKKTAQGNLWLGLKLKNNGTVLQYYVEGDHEAIIPKELFMQVQAELVRRRVVHVSPTGKKRSFSCNHCFAQMVFCGDCGELYRRVHWNNHGCKSIVWRCISRLEPISAEKNCTNRTVNELLLQEITVKAFHQILTERDFFLKVLQQNIAKAVVNSDTLSPDGIQARLEELQKELIKTANNKQDYDAIADEIFRLRDQKEQSEVDSHHREETMNRIKKLQDFIAGQETDITEFDEALVKKLIEKITVFADHFTVEFKSWITIDIEA